MNLNSLVRSNQINIRLNRASTENSAILISLLTTLIGEAETIAKNEGVSEISDESMHALIRKFVKNMDFTIEKSTNVDTIEKVKIEREYLLQYLPAVASRDAIHSFVQATIENTGERNIGFLIRKSKEHFKDAFDAKVASDVIKSLI